MASATIEKVVAPESGAPIFVELREGDALPLLPRQQVNFGGTINTPADYAAHLQAHEKLDAADSRVVVDEHAGTITLYHRHSQDEITEEEVRGALVRNPDLDEFKIFTGSGNPSVRKPELLAEFLRPRRLFFADVVNWADTVAALKKYEASRSQSVAVDTSSQHKNGSFSAKHTQESQLPEISFVLAIPLFRGAPKSTFRVEVCGTVTNGGVDAWLESIDLRDLLETAKQQALEAECQRLRALGLLIVTV